VKGITIFVVKPQEFAEKYPVMRATYILSMIEDHHLLQAAAMCLRTTYKMQLQGALLVAIFLHSNLVEMLWFPECQVPEEYSVTLIPSRHKH
jgi:hypothetical protein